MFNNYYRLNESRWELPEEDKYFQYPNYGYDINDIKKDKSFKYKRGWDEDIIEELTKFYNDYKDFIVTEYDYLDTKEDNIKNLGWNHRYADVGWYWYIDFSYLTLEEIRDSKIKRREKYYNYDWKFNEDEDKTYEVRRVIREHPNLNPSDILFKDYIYNTVIDANSLGFDLSRKLSCVLKLYCFKYINNISNPYLQVHNKYLYFNGHYLGSY